ncbi:head GIN domain-containing protein [Daejeonella rubra]|nr:head GIN domain-containing protein [Daejeonella rubra]
MKKLFFIFSVPFIGILLLSSCGEMNCISGSGNQVTENRNIDPFTKIETSGSMKVVLRQDSLSSLRIVADDNIQKEIQTKVKGNTLLIDMDGSFCDSGPITIYLGSRTFDGIDASGAVEIISDGKLNVQDFAIDLQGSSKVILDLNAANLMTSSSGSSEIILKGQAGSHELDLSGSSEIEALDLIVGKYRINTSGASHSRINVLNELDISSRGASKVEYRGKPVKITNDESGASSLKSIN